MRIVYEEPLWAIPLTIDVLSIGEDWTSELSMSKQIFPVSPESKII